MRVTTAAFHPVSDIEPVERQCPQWVESGHLN